uniref:Uncharacterized protein n=1 Tax=Coccolithus braarudii TaxID=221442 RepID=A0A7S0LQW3_9EUKA|mmetsp:Transcript_5404/g.11930  ORF Transcript_5404/g.11930 Transcript_5404/m.11930 type:complete len:196 (+) Transcript_5404:14-601(+)|eukprot:CAMPEP_0183350140 /NCGR_PEP_ID=MMETSP0164_2-20130417/16979_1 /TAXON_ID=221442 /ORGANISM="Coccolithus pelagicus ssp braarudi, Strain PLY182g" /LENGTH=195 /DNA_ID=CAMNT_0025522013 /DNA_START=18 /DNA_END=605 /DNA_ORIENTATION=+
MAIKTMMVLGATTVSALQTLAPARLLSAVRAGSVSMGVEDMIGKYSVAQIVYDPLDLSTKYDLNWLREAELKHGRVCMLAFAGFIANDAGLKFPGEAFQGISSIEAHDAMVKSGHMWALLAFVGVCESLHMSVVVPKLDGDWGDYEPGNYGIDPFKLDSPSRRESELKNGRLAMLAFAGLVTQAGLGAVAPYTSF